MNDFRPAQVVGSPGFFCRTRFFGVTGGGTVATLTHADFVGETEITISVTAADDLTGNPLAGAPETWSFTTADVAAPQVTGVSPADGATDVALDASLVITFSEAIDAGSFTYTVSPDPGG